MKQLKIAFDDRLRGRLEEAAKVYGTSLADEVRVRVAQTLEHDSVPEKNRALSRAIGNLMDYVEKQTGWPWYEHPFAYDVLRHAINTLLDRVQPKEEPVGSPPRLPVSLVAATDPKAIGAGLEALAVNSPDAQFRPDASLRDAAPIRRLLELQKEDAKANRKIRRQGKRGQS
jgi:hypothetical protein